MQPQDGQPLLRKSQSLRPLRPLRSLRGQGQSLRPQEESLRATLSVRSQAGTRFSASYEPPMPAARASRVTGRA
jgi:hypothetical protein